MTGRSDHKRDWRISAILLAVWFGTLAFFFLDSDRFPLSMLALATLFFIMLVPAMNDLVRSIERRLGGEKSSSQDKPDASQR